jgi:hypothetical protein
VNPHRVARPPWLGTQDKVKSILWHARVPPVYSSEGVAQQVQAAQLVVAVRKGASFWSKEAQAVTLAALRLLVENPARIAEVESIWRLGGAQRTAGYLSRMVEEARPKATLEQALAAAAEGRKAAVLQRARTAVRFLAKAQADLQAAEGACRTATARVKGWERKVRYYEEQGVLPAQGGTDAT